MVPYGGNDVAELCHRGRQLRSIRRMLLHRLPFIRAADEVIDGYVKPLGGLDFEQAFKLYWFDFEICRLQSQPRWEADLALQRELLEELFELSARGHTVV